MIEVRTACWTFLVAGLCLAALPACRKPADAVKSELGEAGLELTATDWFRVVRADDVPAMKKFIAAGFQTGTRDERGDTALHAAAAAGTQAAADLLLDGGMEVDIRGAVDRTPLMAAAAAGQTAMVRWLLRQGADALAKDKEGFTALLLAVREGKSGPVSELAVVHGESLDPALLLAALEGRAEVIDTLTNHGASVYARMEDGRTPLMLAAENGHAAAVELLLDIGASRFSSDLAGRRAADLALAAGHREIAEMIQLGPQQSELVLAAPDEVARTMEEEWNRTSQAASGTETGGLPGDGAPPPVTPAAVPLAGQVLSKAVVAAGEAVAVIPDGQGGTAAAQPPPAASGAVAGSFAMPPLVMRSYRESELPMQVRAVENGTAVLERLSAAPEEVRVATGGTVPGSRLVVVRVDRRVRDSKDNLGQPEEVSVVEVRDPVTGATREWIAGVPGSAHDPVALIEDAATGKRYAAMAGQRFSSADGREFIVSDVRPGQLVIEDAATGAVRTLPLRGRSR